MVGARPLRPRSHADGRRHYVAEAGIRERFTTTSRPGPSQWVALARALEPQDTALSLFVLVRGQVSRRGEARDPPLTSLSSWRPPLYQPWVKSPTNCSSQTVAHLREGPSASLTNGWASLLTVVQWQLGAEPLQCRPMAGQNHKWSHGNCRLLTERLRGEGVTVKQSVSSVLPSRSTLSDPMDCSPPGLPVHHQLPELAQTHVHWVRDAIQPLHLSSASPPAFSLSQNHGLFRWVSSSHKVAKVLEFHLQRQSF